MDRTDATNTPDGPATVRLLVADDANSRLLAQWLADETGMTVLASDGPPDPEDDCCIVDEAGLREHRGALVDWQAGSDVFRPCLLVSERGEAAVPPDAEFVDDVVELPTSMSVLWRRLARLLAARDQSRRLDAERSRLRDQNDRLRMFAGRLAHDLRNPLSIATGYLGELRSEPNDGAIDVVEGALDRIQRLVDETLMLATMGEKAVDTTPLSLEAVAREAWSHVATGDATLVVDGDIAIAADENRLLTLFENLFRNAVEHVGGDVQVRVGPLDGGFYVADDGSGISAHDREQVFEVGYTTNEDGTGFGLRIVREVAEAHGWTVALTDSEEGGAQFEVTGVTPSDEPD
jgi:signal transduction histidine kinase